MTRTKKPRKRRVNWTPRRAGYDCATFRVKITIPRPAAEWLASHTSMSVDDAARWLLDHADETPALNASRQCCGVALIVNEAGPEIVDLDRGDADLDNLSAENDGRVYTGDLAFLSMR